jgi:hypothetical protein
MAIPPLEVDYALPCQHLNLNIFRGIYARAVSRIHACVTRDQSEPGRRRAHHRAPISATDWLIQAALACNVHIANLQF